MPSASSKLYADDVSLLVVTLDTNPFFWSTFPFPFAEFLSQVLAFLNSILLLGQLNQVIVIATGCNSCGYIYDSTSDKNHGSTTGTMPALYSNLLHNLDEFLARDRQLDADAAHAPGTVPSSLLSGSLSMALCWLSDIQRAFRSGPMPPQPRVPIDSCYIGSNNSAFLQQASYITGGIYYKPPQLDGLYQYLSTVFATDLHSRAFLRLPKSVGVDFRASCFCHKQTIDMGYVCSVCLSIFCEHHDKCSTCGSVFGQAQLDASAADRQRKA
ncbi:hypothetical protein JHK85_015359 [Glycine max]|nr:hypothetical protein JHK85_015359 [Glycine max]